MKGIVLAGGSGSRLHPVTLGVSKQMVPVYNKPMIYYPLSTLMLAGIRDILIITTPHDQDHFKILLGDGNHFGARLQYATQPAPEGIAQAFVIGAEFVGDDRVALALGDNIFFGHGMPESLRSAADRETGATVFGYRVRDPQRYGVVEFDESGKVISLEEKPQHPRSPYAVTGLYFYDNRVVEIASSLRPSERGELEITDVNRTYLERGELCVEMLGRGIAWLDTGTHDSLLQASNYIQAIEERQGLMVACLEEVAYKMGFIDAEQVRSAAEKMKTNSYGQYLLHLLEEEAEEELAVVKVNVRSKLKSIDAAYEPKIVGELNGQYVKLARFDGEYVWHHHEHEDEMFLVVDGSIEIHFRDRVVPLDPGEFIVVPRGVEHKPVAKGPAHVMLFEPASTRNTGNVDHAYTIEPEDLERL